MTFIDKLSNRWQQADSLLCVGLDPDPSKFPDAFVDDDDALFSFCRDIADATAAALNVRFIWTEREEGET